MTVDLAAGTWNEIPLMRSIVLLFISLALCQCTTVQSHLAPVVRPGTAEKVLLTLKPGSQPRPSQFIVALENLQEDLVADNKANRGFVSILGVKDDPTQKAVLGIQGPQFEAETKAGAPILVMLPFIKVVTDRVPPAQVTAAMPQIQAYCYRLLSRQFRFITADELKSQKKP